MSQFTWVIVGGSSAIAKAFSHQCGQAADDVILLGRDDEDLQNTAHDLQIRYHIAAYAFAFDINKVAEFDQIIKSCQEVATSPLSLFFVAGVMSSQETIDSDTEQLLLTLTTNYLSPVVLLTRFAKLFLAQKDGHLVVLGSVAGDRGRLKNYVYGSTKSGLHVYVQGLHARLHPHHVKVTLVKPGFVDTTMTYGLGKLPLMISPMTCAKACYNAAMKGKAIVYVPWFWRNIMFVLKLIPQRFFIKLKF